MNVPVVTYTIIYNNQTFYYREHLDKKAGLYDLEILDSNNIKLDEESDLFNEIMDWIEGTFIQLYRDAN